MPLGNAALGTFKQWGIIASTFDRASYIALEKGREIKKN